MISKARKIIRSTANTHNYHENLLLFISAFAFIATIIAQETNGIKIRYQNINMPAASPSTEFSPIFLVSYYLDKTKAPQIISPMKPVKSKIFSPTDIG